MRSVFHVCLLTAVVLTCVLGGTLLAAGGHSTAAADSHSNLSTLLPPMIDPPPLPPISPSTPTETPTPTSTPTPSASPTPVPTRRPPTDSPPTETATPSQTDTPAETQNTTPASPLRSAPGATSIEIAEASISPDWVRAGYTSTVQATLWNPGPRDNLTIHVTHDGTPVATRNATVPSWSTSDLSFVVTFETPRSGPVEVNDVTAGDLTVATATEGSTISTATAAEDQHGFGLFLGLFALLVGLLAARTSRRE